MNCLLIYHYNILDAERIEELGPLSLPIVEKYGGELVVASSVGRLEGSPFNHMVMYRFKSQDVAQRFYESEESRALSILRNQVTEGFVVFVPENGAAILKRNETSL